MTTLGNALRWHLAVVAGLLAVMLGFAAPASAHWADLAVAEVDVAPTSATLTLTVPTGLLDRADTDRNGQLSAAEVAANRAWLTRRLGEAVTVTADGTPAGLTVAHAPKVALPAGPGGAPDRHSTLRLSYEWPRATANVVLGYTLFLPEAPGASCMATVIRGDEVRQVVFTPARPRVALQEAGPWQQAATFVALGFEHILIGYDHVLFLIALLMLGGGLAYLLKVVTAFTVAHSITLALATFGVVALPSRLVESAIALSIAYVAAETFWRKDLKGRWVLTLIFGLVHGLGFASVLQELDVAGGNLAVSLIGFNVGVELGQILIVTVAWAALSWVRRQSWDLGFRRSVSAGVVVMGLVWFVERAWLA